jgi:hypothetical protein
VPSSPMLPDADDEFVIRVPQRCETMLRTVSRAQYYFRLAYARASETQAAGDVGQDFLTLRDNGCRHSFALCDGVGQSFMGDLAAKLLGDFLRDWMWELDPEVTAMTIAEQLGLALTELASGADQQVRTYRLPRGLPPLVHDALERKRRSGTESTFVCGLVDPSANMVAFTWMGDSRLRLWGSDNQEQSDAFGDNFRTAERWSSRRGPIGVVHSFVGSFDQYSRVAAYSDGLSLLDTSLSTSPDGTTLTAFLDATEKPLGDDASLIEIVFASPAHPDPSANWVSLANLSALLEAANQDTETVGETFEQIDAEIPTSLPTRSVQRSRIEPVSAAQPTVPTQQLTVPAAFQNFAASLIERLRADAILLQIVLTSIIVLLLVIIISLLLVPRRSELPILAPAASATSVLTSPMLPVATTLPALTQTPGAVR